MAITGFEIDFLPVGEKSASGDAILFRYKEDGEYKIILIDGGHKESDGVKTSDRILKHLRTYYYPDVASDKEMRIDHIICSHPDNDHVGGLQEVMEQCNVTTLWVNDPTDYVTHSNLADESNADSFCKGDADTVTELIEVADGNAINVKSPKQGAQIGPLVVASPSSAFYSNLVKGNLVRQGDERASFKSKFIRAVTKVVSLWSEDKLKDYPATSVCNESSTILYGKLMDEPYHILLTADAGIEALSRAYDYLEEKTGFSSESLTFIQIPHHGGRHNVNVDVLDNLLGKKIPQGNEAKRGISLVSVAKEAADYPKKAVSNAFLTRGYKCFSTRENNSGFTVWHHKGDMPKRKEFSSATPIEYFSEVESVD